MEKRFSHGLQLQAAYTWSKSLDWASSFEETVNPFDYKVQPRSVALQFGAAFCPQLLLGISRSEIQRIQGKSSSDDWAMSGIIQFQSGFPIRIQTQDDNELISSLFFLSADAPQLTGPLQIAVNKYHQEVNGNFSSQSGSILGSASRQLSRPRRVPFVAVRERTSGTLLSPRGFRFQKRDISSSAPTFSICLTKPSS